MTRRSGLPPRIRLLVLLGATFLLAGWILFVAWIIRPPDEEVHSYQGTTWIGDTCHVDDDGVLWCGPSG